MQQKYTKGTLFYRKPGYWAIKVCMFKCITKPSVYNLGKI